MWGGVGLGDALIIGVSGMAVLLVLVYIILRRCAFVNEKEESNHFDETQSNLEEGGSDYGAQTPVDLTKYLATTLEPKFKIPRAEFTYDLPSMNPDQSVFYGYFHTVRKHVALNRVVSFSESNSKVLLRKIQVIAAIGEHPNLVTFLGISATNLKSGELYMISEKCEKGNLLNYLKSQKEMMVAMGDCGNNRRLADIKEEIKVEYFHQFCQWSKEIASAMAFLGSKNVVLIDVAAKNIFLTENLVAKIGDFGLAERRRDSVPFLKDTVDSLPFKSMAMECWLKMEFSTQSDVWAYGITLWEIFSFGAEPYAKMSPKTIMTSLQMGYRLPLPDYAFPEIYTQMLSCWDFSPENRPSFEELEKFFSSQNLNGD